MPSYLRSALIPCALLALAAPLSPSPTADIAIPSYRAALEDFNAKRTAAGGPKLSARDREVMRRSAQDLAVAIPKPGLLVGQQAPDFTLPNAFGNQVRLADLLAHGPVVLTFYRGAWCPYCNLQLRGLSQALPLIEAEGARLVAVTPQLPDKSRAQVEKDSYPFEILSDLDSRVMSAYRLYFEVPVELSRIYKERLSLDLAEYNGQGRYVLPVPGTYVIDRTGRVRMAFADTDYRKRAEPADILAALREL